MGHFFRSQKCCWKYFLAWGSLSSNSFNIENVHVHSAKNFSNHDVLTQNKIYKRSFPWHSEKFDVFVKTFLRDYWNVWHSGHAFLQESLQNRNSSHPQSFSSVSFKKVFKVLTPTIFCFNSFALLFVHSL